MMDISAELLVFIFSPPGHQPRQWVMGLTTSINEIKITYHRHGQGPIYQVILDYFNGPLLLSHPL